MNTLGSDTEARRLLRLWVDAFSNRGETTSLHEWNARMKEVDASTRQFLWPNTAPSQSGNDNETGGAR